MRPLRLGSLHWLAAGALALLLGACGGGSDAGSSAASGNAGGLANLPSTPALTNFQEVTVDAGPANSVNALYTSVTVCPPNATSGCAVIDHVLVDTGSTGLRLLSSAVPAALRESLPAQAVATGKALVECTQFADGYSWGPVRLASIKLGGETIASLPIQLIGDPAFVTVPGDCSATGPSENTVADFGANGVLGLGHFQEDCGAGCAQGAVTGFYYACGVTGCSSTSVATALQVRQPVTLLAKDNNGVLLRLPTPPAAGAVSLSGSLIFGIGTQSNNGLGTARILTVDPGAGTLQISIDGRPYATSFLDSGSNGLFFPSPGTPVCDSKFYCPTTPQSFNAIVQGKNGVSIAQTLTVANADTLFTSHPEFAVAPFLGGPGFDSATADLGLPFFFGRTVFTAVEGRATPGGVGPYVAF